MRLPAAVSFLLGLALGAVPAAAQTVGGSVLEEEAGVAVAGATVSLQQVGSARRASTITDAAGRFLVRLAGRSGRYLVRVAHPSYLELQDTLQLNGDESVTLRLQLGRQAIPLAPLVVTARSQRRLQEYYDRLNRGTGFGRFLTRGQLNDLPANRATDYLRRFPGVRLERVEGGSLITIDNGLGTCTPLIYVDGMPMAQGGLVDDFLQPGTLEGIEFYPGTVGMPAQFAAAQQTGCGVLAFWTQDVTGRPLTWMRLVLSAAAMAAFVITSLKILL